MLLRFIENLRPIVPEVLECHQNKLPKGIGVKYVQDGESGKWFAVIRLEKEDLFTEANSREGLEYSVNDAVASYFDILLILSSVSITRSSSVTGRIRILLKGSSPSSIVFRTSSQVSQFSMVI